MNQEVIFPLIFVLKRCFIERAIISISFSVINHVVACLVVGWLQLITVNLINYKSNNNIIIIISKSVIAHSLSYNCRMAKLSP